MEIKLERLVKTYYETLKEGKVLARKCPACGNVEWPPVYACNVCGNYVTEWIELSKKAQVLELYVPTAMSMKPAYKSLEPYAYAWIKLEEGPERNIMLRGVTRENAPYIFAHLPYPCHLEIVQNDPDFMTCVAAIDPIDADGNPVEIKEKAAAPAAAEAPAAETAASAAPIVETETIKTIIELVAETYQMDEAGLSAASSFETEIKGPSVKFLGMTARLEDIYDITLSMAEASAAKNIAELAELVDSLRDDIDPAQRTVASAVVSCAAPAAAASTADPETIQTIIELVAETYNMDAAGLSADSSFETEIKGPSVKFLGMTARLEDIYDITLSMAEASAAKTIAELAELVDSLKE